MSEPPNEEKRGGESSAVDSSVISKSPVTPPTVSPESPEEIQAMINILGQATSVEHARIDMQNKRTDVFRRALDVQDASDQRQYDYHVKALESNDAKERESRKIGGRLVTILLVGGFLLIGSLLAVALFGDESQGESAIAITKYFFTGLGGYGVLRMAERIFRRFFR